MLLGQKNTSESFYGQFCSFSLLQCRIMQFPVSVRLCNTNFIRTLYYLWTFYLEIWSTTTSIVMNPKPFVSLTLQRDNFASLLKEFEVNRQCHSHSAGSSRSCNVRPSVRHKHLKHTIFIFMFLNQIRKYCIQLTFPAVTVCNSNRISCDRFKKVYDQLDKTDADADKETFEKLKQIACLDVCPFKIDKDQLSCPSTTTTTTTTTATTTSTTTTTASAASKEFLSIFKFIKVNHHLFTKGLC